MPQDTLAGEPARNLASDHCVQFQHRVQSWETEEALRSRSSFTYRSAPTERITWMSSANAPDFAASRVSIEVCTTQCATANGASEESVATTSETCWTGYSCCVFVFVRGLVDFGRASRCTSEFPQHLSTSHRLINISRTSVHGAWLYWELHSSQRAF